MYRNHWPLFLAALVLLLTIPLGAAAAQDADAAVCLGEALLSGEENLAGICITTLPESRLGTVTLGNRILRPGDVLTADQAAQMTFSPATPELDTSIQVGYLPIFPDHVAPEASMTLSVRGKENKPPVAEDSAMETYKNMANTGKLKVHDPEGQSMVYAITRQPKRGTVTIGENGSYTYTPKNNKVGIDSFVYTASDPEGKTSREATVTITILKPTAPAQYADTAGKDCCFAAEWMKNTGIFTGEVLAGRSCFHPEKVVTRGEFAAMLVKALDIPVEEDITYTGYEDDIPKWLRPYLAAAVRSGLTAELADQEHFDEAAALDGTTAAAMLCSGLKLSVQTETALQEDTAAAWEQAALAALAEKGIHLHADDVLTREQIAELLYQVNQILGSK